MNSTINVESVPVGGAFKLEKKCVYTLEHQKEVLEKMLISKDLFLKEVMKSMARLSKSDQNKLWLWSIEKSLISFAA